MPRKKNVREHAVLHVQTNLLTAFRMDIILILSKAEAMFPADRNRDFVLQGLFLRNLRL